MPRSVSAGVAADALGLRPRQVVTAGGEQEDVDPITQHVARDTERPEASLLVALRHGGIVDAPVCLLRNPWESWDTLPLPRRRR